FAFTLGLTTVLDVVVVFFFTKPLLTLMARRPFFARGHKWSGLDPKALGAKPPLRRTRRPVPAAVAAADPRKPGDVKAGHPRPQPPPAPPPPPRPRRRGAVESKEA